MKKILSYAILFILIISPYIVIEAKDCQYSNGDIGFMVSVSKDGNISASPNAEGVTGIFTACNEKLYEIPLSPANFNDYFYLNGNKIDFMVEQFLNNNDMECPSIAFIFLEGYGCESGEYKYILSDQKHFNDFENAFKTNGYKYVKLDYISSQDDPINSENQEPIPDSCADYNGDEKGCRGNKYFSCVWVESEYGNYCNVDNLQYVQCANAFDIPHQVPELTSFGINFLKIITPIILIVTSIITLVKALMASKEDEIKKATGTLKRRLIAAALVFFVIYIVQFVIMKVADSSETEDISTCLSCFINNDCQDNIYYKTNVGGTYTCRYLKDKKTFDCPENNE